MALDALPAEVMATLLKSVAAGVAGNWVSTPVPARLAILTREELIRWVRGTFPAAAIEKEDSPTLEHVAVRIYTPRDCHRVEVRGIPCVEPPREVVGRFTELSWLVLAHACAEPACRRLAQWHRRLEEHDLRAMGECLQTAGADTVTLSLWMGRHAPEGCPACLPVPGE